jgi:hypothetical protein
MAFRLAVVDRPAGAFQPGAALANCSACNDVLKDCQRLAYCRTGRFSLL